MENQFQPELGQAIFGQPSKTYNCPDILDAALEFIRSDLKRVLWNLRQDWEDPFGNSGEHFVCEDFEVHAYSWNDEVEQPFNFKDNKSGIEVSWYKYCGRGMSCNMEVTPDMASALLTSVMASLCKVESGEMQFNREPQ